MESAAYRHSGFVLMLKNVFRRNILYLILTQLFALIITTIVTMGKLDLKPLESTDITPGYSMFLSSVLEMFSFVITLIAVYILYRELFSRKASDLLLSMPIKREAFFNANAFFCVLNITLLYVNSFIVSVFLIKSDVIYPAKFYIFDIAVFAKLFLISFLFSISVFTLFTVCAAISGRKWHYFILCYFSVFSVYGVAIGFSNYINSIWGFAIDYDYSFIVSPVASAMVSVNEKLKNILVLVIVLIVQIAIVYAAGLFVFKYRKSEVTETTISGKILPFIMITAFLLSGAVIVLSFSNHFYLNLMLALIVMILSMLIITALFYRKPFNKLTLTSLIVSFCITAIAVFCVDVIPRVTGYVNYIPETSKVECVTIEMSDFDKTQSVSLLSDFFSLPYTSDDYYIYNRKSYTVSTDEAKSAVSVLHKKLISDETIYEYYNDNDEYTYDTINKISLKYVLKNGKTVLRTYCVNASSVYNEAAEFFKTDECLKKLPPMNFENEDVLFIIADFSDDNRKNIQYIELDEYKTLMEAIEKDIKNYSSKDFVLRMSTGFSADFYNDEDFDDNYFLGDFEEPNLLFKITIDKFSDSATKEHKEKMRRMSPDEMIKYDNDNVIKNNYKVDYLLDYTVVNVRKSDKNIIRYFESLGYKF